MVPWGHTWSSQPPKWHLGMSPVIENRSPAMSPFIIFFWPLVITHAGCIAAGVGKAFSRVCLFFRALKGKRLEVSTSNFVHIHVYSIEVARHALPRGQKVKSKGHTVTKTVTVARLPGDACCYGRVACVCMSIRLPMFSSCDNYY